MTWFTFIPPIEISIGIPLKIFYLEDLSCSSKVILLWINKYLKEKREANIGELDRKSFMEFSGFKNEKTLRNLRRELVPLFPSSKDLLRTLL